MKGKESTPLVSVTMMILQNLFEEQPGALYELVMKARNGNYTLWDNTSEILKQSALIGQDGNIHDSIRNIIINAVSGDGLGLSIVDCPTIVDC